MLEIQGGEFLKLFYVLNEFCISFALPIKFFHKLFSIL